MACGDIQSAYQLNPSAAASARLCPASESSARLCASHPHTASTSTKASVSATAIAHRPVRHVGGNVRVAVAVRVRVAVVRVHAPAECDDRAPCESDAPTSKPSAVYNRVPLRTTSPTEK